MDIPENPVHPAGDSQALLASLTEADRSIALERLRTLLPHLEQGLFVTELAAATGVPRRTLTRWLSLYRKGGLAALARRDRADKGARRGVPSRIREAVEGLALRRPRLPVTAIHRRISGLAREMGEKPPGLKGVITENGINRTLSGYWAAHTTISGPLALNLPVNFGENRAWHRNFQKSFGGSREVHFDPISP